MRMTASRKAAIIQLVHEYPDAKDRILSENNISQEEFDRWVELFLKGGRNALRATHVQQWRQSNTALHGAI